MKYFAILTLVLAFTPSLARADLLWDNGRWDQVGNVRSERNAETQDSWAVDDVVFEAPVRITGMEWISIMTDEFEPTGGDVILLSDDFDKHMTQFDLELNREELGKIFGFSYYRASIHNLDIVLEPGSYLIGARPVGDGIGSAFTGLNDVVLGNHQAHFRSAELGFEDWTPVESIFGDDRDIAFQVFGKVIPAPGPWVVLILGWLTTRPRRRSGPHSLRIALCSCAEAPQAVESTDALELS